MTKSKIKNRVASYTVKEITKAYTELYHGVYDPKYYEVCCPTAPQLIILLRKNRAKKKGKNESKT